MAQNGSETISFRVNFRWVSLALLLALLVCVAMWRPWQGSGRTGQREISVTGTTTVTAAPDKFMFYPSYEFKNIDKKQALDEVAVKQKEVVEALKNAGVKDKEIKADSNGYRGSFYQNDSKEYVYTLTIQVTSDTMTEAQKIQDVLLATNPSGQVSPQAQFSQAKQKELEAKARVEASADARKKADQMATNIGFKVGKVKSIVDGSIYGGPILAMSESDTDMKSVGSVGSQPALGLQPGQNDLPYSIQVTYYIR